MNAVAEDTLNEVVAEAGEWRRRFHAAPELRYEEHGTAAFIADKLHAFGFDRVETGIGKTGVVGVLRGRRPGPGRNIGLRADMDALPIHEANDVAHKSRHAGIMHACGHDGHSATLLAAARYLSADRDFAGTAVFIFQPAEEGGAGGKAMIDDGLFTRFDVDEVYGLHNMPNLALGPRCGCHGGHRPNRDMGNGSDPRLCSTARCSRDVRISSRGPARRHRC